LRAAAAALRRLLRARAVAERYMPHDAKLVCRIGNLPRF